MRNNNKNRVRHPSLRRYTMKHWQSNQEYVRRNSFPFQPPSKTLYSEFMFTMVYLHHFRVRKKVWMIDWTITCIHVTFHCDLCSLTAISQWNSFYRKSPCRSIIDQVICDIYDSGSSLLHYYRDTCYESIVITQQLTYRSLNWNKAEKNTHTTEKISDKQI